MKESKENNIIQKEKNLKVLDQNNSPRAPADPNTTTKPSIMKKNPTESILPYFSFNWNALKEIIEEEAGSDPRREDKMTTAAAAPQHHHILMNREQPNHQNLSTHREKARNKDKKGAKVLHKDHSRGSPTVGEKATMRPPNIIERKLPYFSVDWKAFEDIIKQVARMPNGTSKQNVKDEPTRKHIRYNPVDEVGAASERTEQMETDNIELRLPSLEDVHTIKMSETPLSTAKELFLQCKYLLNRSDKNLSNKQLKLINEIGIKLMEMLDYLCSALDEKKS